MTDHGGLPDSASADPWAHITKDTLVMWTKNYVVYVSPAPDMELKWETIPEFDTELPTLPNYASDRYNRIFCDAGVLEARVRKEFGIETRREILCLIGNALVCNFEREYDAAEKALDDARQFLRERSEELSRFWYLSASFVMAFIFFGFGTLTWIARSCLEHWLGATVVWLGLAAVAGAAGALLSVILRSGKLAFDPSSGRLLHYLEGASRIWAGALSGAFVSLAVKSDVVLGALGVRSRIP